MPNLIERLFRAMILYVGLWWLVTVLWRIPASYVMWTSLGPQGLLRDNELYCAVVLLLIYGSCPIIGLISVSYFRKLADWQYRQIPGIVEMAEPQWHDTAVFAGLLSTGTGLYCLNLFFRSLSDLFYPLMMLGAARGDITGIAVIDVWYYHWQSLLIPVVYLACAAVLLTQSHKVVACVTRMIDTTPLPKSEDEEDDPLVEPPVEPPAEGGIDEQST